MNHKALRPEDMMPNNEDNIENSAGVKIRKGTVAAILANIDIIESNNSSADEKLAAKEMIHDLAPALITINWAHHVTFNNPEIQNIINVALAEVSP